MRPIINDRVIEEVKERADLVDIIGHYTELKKKGNSYMGLCPFHQEKTPSFSVQNEKGFFHCFGCGKSGDVITFVMEKENLTFQEAVAELAEELHVPLSYGGEEDEEKKRERERIFAMNRAAALFYMDRLSKYKYGIDYLSRRKITREIILSFGLGYAPSDGNSLLNHLLIQGYEEEEMLRANLVSQSEKNGRYFDRFRNRIMFPIIDEKARILGFGGRVLDDALPKYLNSSDTPVFTKGNHLYGINILQKESDREKIILVEGYMDVIALYKNGINYGVASLGTALTREQVRKIKRYGKEIFICYDGDSAGEKATLRAIDIFRQEDLRPKIIRLPEKMDPDDFMEERGVFEFEALQKRALPAIEYEIKLLEKNFDLSSSEALTRFLQEVAKVLNRITSSIEQEIYVNQIAETYKVSREALRLEMGKNKKRGHDLNPSAHFKETKEQDSSFDIRIYELLLYSLESEEFFQMIVQNPHFQELQTGPQWEIFQDVKEMYGEKSLCSEDCKRNFFNRHGGDISQLSDKVAIDIQRGEEVISELMEILYLETLKRRRDRLIDEISQLEHRERSQEEDVKLTNYLQELSQLSKKLHHR